MLTLSQINSVKSEMATLTDAMQTRLDRLNAEITRAKSDGTRSPQYIRETIEKLQSDALPFFGEGLKKLYEQDKLIRAQKTAWESKPLLLSMQKFTDNDSADSTIRLRYATELSKMNADLLRLTADLAKEESNLPVVYQCYLAANSDPTHAVDLSDVEIPDQAEALAAITACLALPSRGELIAGQSTTAGLTALRKLELARQMQAA